MKHVYTLSTAVILSLTASSTMAISLTRSITCNPAKSICFQVKNTANKAHQFSIKQSGVEILHLPASTIRDDLSDLPTTNLTLKPADLRNIAELTLGETGVTVE